MLIEEFRTILPFSLDEYERGQQMLNDAMSKIECVDIIRQEPFTSTTLKPGKKLTGIYTQKLQHPRVDVPDIYPKMFPGCDILYEESWDAYPYSKTVFTNPYMKENFRLCIESYHVEDRGEQQNLLELSDEELKMRKVVFLDFAGDKKIREFKSEKTGRGPLRKGWEQNHYPIICSYKVVSANFNWFGLQYFYEYIIMRSCERRFLEFYRDTYLSIDSWCHLTSEKEVQSAKEKMREVAKNRLEKDRARLVAASHLFEISQIEKEQKLRHEKKIV